MKIRKLLCIALSMAFAANVYAKSDNSGVHLFGFAASFNDSTVYFTDIQYVDSAYIGKSNMLYSRESYSVELQNYLKSTGIQHPTCITVFAKGQKEIEKKYLQLRKRYEKGGRYDIRPIALSAFRYHGIMPDESDLHQEKLEKQALKAQKKAEKQAKKEAKRKQKLAEKGIIEQPNSPAQSEN